MEPLADHADEHTGRVTFPAATPHAVLELVSFLEAMDNRMRSLRDDGSLPRAALSLPTELSALVTEMHSRMSEQAHAALARGDDEVMIWHPRGPALEALLGWAEPREDLLLGIVRAGMVRPGWERPVQLMTQMWAAAREQLGAQSVPTGAASR